MCKAARFKVANLAPKIPISSHRHDLPYLLSDQTVGPALDGHATKKCMQNENQNCTREASTEGDHNHQPTLTLGPESLTSA